MQNEQLIVSTARFIGYKSSGFNPVTFAILASILGPISSPS